MKHLRLIKTGSYAHLSLTQGGGTFLLSMKIHKYAFGYPRHLSSTGSTMLSGTDSWDAFQAKGGEQIQQGKCF